MKQFIFPAVAAVVVGSLSMLLLTVVLRSPYTHANLVAQFDPRYMRSEVALVGPARGYQGTGLAQSPVGAGGLEAFGKALFAQAVIGAAREDQGPGGAATSSLLTASVETRGQALLVVKGCAACHGLEGRGGAVGPAVAGFDLEDLRAKTTKGPGGMPAYPREEVSDEDLVAMAAYLQAAGKQVAKKKSSGG